MLDPKISHSLEVNVGDSALGKFGEVGGGWSGKVCGASRNERSREDGSAWEARPRRA